MFAEILLPQKVGKDKDTLTYSLSEASSFKVGQIVEVPLRNKKVKGVIHEIHNNKPPYNTKEILGLVSNAPHLSEWQIKLLNWVSEYYMAPLFKSLKLFLPVPFVKKKKIQALDISDETKEIENHKHELTDKQKEILERILLSKKVIQLIYGITGSGKTEIYMHYADKIIHEGKQILMLVPEISLTPQTVQRFDRHFNHKIAVIHSQLTPKQKEREWLKIHSGEAKVVIGSRSAIFAPFKNLGTIIMDEEHDASYKQDQSPRYNTLDVAKKIAEILNIKIILGSATPRLETYYKSLQGEFELHELSERPILTNSSLPNCFIVDLRDELKKKNYSIFSDLLQEKIAEKLKNKEQVILFLNRRGAASAVICRVCGYVMKCRKCQIALTYHQKLALENSIYKAERLICHHCGLMEQIPTECPQCQSGYIKYIGVGTQRVETEVNKLFPEARVIRADRDTVTKRDDFKNIYDSFKNHGADILIGTQMIALGLHLPKVNLVGIILADMGLTIPDFRSSEKSFQLLTQVAGRAGRAGHSGEVVIQTYLPDNYVVQTASKHDYKNFYQQELTLRNQLSFPPFTKLIKLTIAETKEIKAIQQTESIFNELNALNESPEFKTPENHNQITFYPALFPKLKNKYRWHILISGQNPQKILKSIKLPDEAIIDVDPISTV